MKLLRALLQRVSLIITLVVLLVVGLAFVPVITAAVSPDPVSAAWKLGRDTGSYGFTSDVQIVTAFNGSVTNVGRRGRSDTLHMEGKTNLRDNTLAMQLWMGGGTVTDQANSIGIRFADGQSKTRTGDGAWQDGGGPIDAVAPGGDLMQYLRAVKNVRAIGSEQRGGITFTRYAFEINAPMFAEYMREQTEAALLQKGQLLPGIKIETPTYYLNMTGSGELWVGQDGMPLRQLLDLSFPEARDQRQSATITVHFKDWGKDTVGPGSMLDAVRRYAPSPVSALSFALVVMLMVALVHFRHSRQALRVLSIVLIPSIVLGPFLDNLKTASFLTAQVAQAASNEDQRAQMDQRQRAQDASLTAAFNPHQNPLDLAAQRAGATGLPTQGMSNVPLAALTDDGTDTDGDGLTNFQEERVNTDPTYNDSDEDGVLDGVEVKGFVLGGKTWYLDATKPDTNADGLVDGLECRPDATKGACTLDTDGDGIPDVFDADNDNDGVEDGKDMSPFTSTVAAAAFTDANPFRLQLRNLAPAKPTFVDFQIRPRNPAHLNYSTSVLDWPSDSQGQIRDIDGKTFADVQATNSASAKNDADGDMRLIPMLEIRVAGASNYLPPQSDLTPYNISVKNYTPDGNTKAVYVPLTLQTDEKTGTKLGFTARMRYLPVANPAAIQDVRLVWGVQTLMDLPCDKNAPNAAKNGCGADGYVRNSPQIIQSYYDDWSLTGLNVREDNGADVAVVYKDPAVDPKLKDDAPMYALAEGLDSSFLAGRDQDANNQRDVTVSEIARRFNRDTNGGVTASQRWAIPNVLRVEQSSYPTIDQAVQTLAVTETKRILNTRFADVWQADKTLKPLLLYATEQRYRSANLEGARANDGYVGLSGSTLTVDMAPTGKPPVALQTSARVNWTPYCGAGASSPTWEPCDSATYANDIIARYGSDLNGPGDNNDPLLLSANEAMLQMYTIALITGAERLVQSDARIVAGPYRLKTDTETEVLVRVALLLGGHAVADIAKTVIEVRWEEKVSMRKFLGTKYAEIKGKFDVVDIVKNINQSNLNRLQGGALAAGGMLLVTGFVTVGAATAFPQLFPNAQDAYMGGRIALGTTMAAWTAYSSIYSPLSEAKEAIKLATSAGQKLSWSAALDIGANKLSERVAIGIGAVFSVGITWGFFIYSATSNNLSAFSPEFNKAFAEALATTIYIIVTAVLAATGIGSIIIGIISVIDAILGAICAGGVDALRKVPGLGGACFTLGTTAIKIIAYLLYNYDTMINTKRDDLVVLGTPKVRPQNLEKGYVEGNPLHVTLPLTNTVVHKNPDPSNGFYINFYLYYFSQNNLRTSTVRQTLTTAPQALDAALNQMPSEWKNVGEDHKYIATPMYRGQRSQTLNATVSTLQPGLNRTLPLNLNMGYAVPAYECWGVPTPFFLPPFVIPICYTREFKSNSSTPFTALQYDILPDTLDKFMTLSTKRDNGLGLAWDAQFPGIRDADGDGLISSAFGGLDPNDATPDADNDGLSDALELERRQAGFGVSPIQVDTDSDGLSDRQELALGSDPARADTDNDGLTDGQEVRHERIDPSTGVATGIMEGGWAVTINGATPFTTFVSSNPLQADSDLDGVSDQAERELAASSDPANRVDKQNVPYHPLVANIAPIAVYPAISDADGFVRPGQTFAYTSTVIANVPVAPNVLNVDVPPALGAARPPVTLPFNPATFNGSQTIESAFTITVPGSTATGKQVINSAVAGRLQPNVGPPWRWNIAVQPPLGGINPPAKALGIGATGVFGTNNDFILSSLSSNRENFGIPQIGGNGEVTTYAIPGGSSRAIEADVGDTSAKRGANAPSLACNAAGQCMAVWDEVDQCNTLTINSIRVDVVQPGEPGNGSEPIINWTPTGGAKRQVWRFNDPGSGGNDMTAGTQRGPNAFNFPVTINYCGSGELEVLESDAFSDDFVGKIPLNYNDYAINFPQTLSNLGNTMTVNFTNATKTANVIKGAMVDSSGQTIGAPFRVDTDVPNRFLDLNVAPVVASDGSNFMVAWSRVTQTRGSTGRALLQTSLQTRLFNGTGTALAENPSILFDTLEVESGTVGNDAPLFAQSARITELAITWAGDRYRVARRLRISPTVVIQPGSLSARYGGNGIALNSLMQIGIVPQALALSSFNMLSTLASYDEANGSIGVAYDPVNSRTLLAVTNDQNQLIGMLFLNDSTTPLTTKRLDSDDLVANARAVYYAPAGGWLLGWRGLAGVRKLQLWAADLNAPVLPVEPISNLAMSEPGSTLAAPPVASAPTVDLRFEELPGATGFADSSVRGNNATCSGAACPTAGYAGAPNAPLSDYAARFVGTQELTVPRTVQDRFTLSAWINIAANLQSSSVGTITQQGTGAGSFQWQVVTQGNGRARLRFTASGNTLDANAANDMLPGTWYHVAATRNSAGQVRLYVNGVEVAAATLAAGALNAPGLMRVGTSYRGLIDHFQVFASDLAAASVAGIANNTVQPYAIIAGPSFSSDAAQNRNAVAWARLGLAQADNRGGRITASATLPVVVDSDRPIARASFPNNGYLQGDNTPGAPPLLIGGTASDATSGVRSVTLIRAESSGVLRYPANGTTSWTTQLPAAEGSYRVSAIATDLADNTSDPSDTAATTVVHVDATAPQLTIATSATPLVPTQATDGTWRAQLNGTAVDPNLVTGGTFAGSGVAETSVEVLLQSNADLAAQGTWQRATLTGTNWALNYVLASGAADPTGLYTVRMRAADKVGNLTGDNAFTAPLALDATGPVAVLSSQDVGRQVITDTVKLSGLVTDTGSLAGVDTLEAAFVPIEQVIPAADSLYTLPLDERAGAVYFSDASSSLVATTCAPAGCPTAGVAGRIDGAAQFNGAQALRVTSTAALNAAFAASWSISVWVKTTVGGEILTHGASGNGLAIDPATGQATYTVFQRSSGISEGLSGGPDLRDGQWHQVAVRVNHSAERLNLFIDGDAVVDFNIEDANLVGQDFFAVGGINTLFNGTLDQLSIFGRPLLTGEVATLYAAGNRIQVAATLGQRGVRATTFDLQVPAGLEGQYQIDLRGKDTLGNALLSAAAWRGVIDTQAPRITLEAVPTGASYFDAASQAQRYQIAYTCTAEDRYLDDKRFVCAGNGIQPATRSFANDPIVARLFPDLVVRNKLANSYTLWDTTTKPGATVSACDVYGRCATERLDGQAPSRPIAPTKPEAVILAPANRSIIAGTDAVSVTVAAQSAAPLQSVAIKLDGVTINTITFAQADTITNMQRSINVPVAEQGFHNLTVIATDWNGVTQDDGFITGFTLDTEDPAAAINTTTLGVADTYQLGSGILRLKGTATDVIGLAAVKVSVDDQPFMDAEFDGSTWHVAYPVKDPEGRSLVLTVRATDLAGRRTEVSGRIGTNLVNSPAPDTKIDSGPPSSTNQGSATFTFSEASGAFAPMFECRVDSAAFIPCASPTTQVDLSIGTHIFAVRAVGSDGSVDLSPASYTWVITRSTPDVTLTSTPAATSTVRTATFGFSGDAAATFECQLNGGSWKPCATGQSYANLPEGTHVFQVRAKDVNGTVGTIVRYTWRIVNAVPVAEDQTLSTNVNRSVGVILRVTDTDTLLYRFLRKPAHGIVIGAAPNLTYIPDPGFSGTDSFTFVASDDEAESNVATVSILVSGISTIPIYLPLITR